MDNLARISFRYHSGGYGTPDQFFTETLKVDFDCISYEKKWEYLDLLSRCEALDGSEKCNIEWKLYRPNGGFGQPVHQLVSMFGGELAGARLDRDEVCDGDRLEYIAILPTGYVVKNSFCPCAKRELIGYIRKYLERFIPDDVALPYFLRKKQREELEESGEL